MDLAGSEPAELDQLWRQARRGRRGDQAELLSRLQDPLFRFCQSQLWNRGQAEDAVQETALRLLTNIERFHGNSSVKSWAFGIALNVCREMRRVGTRGTTTDAEELIASQPCHSPRSTECLAEQQDEASALRRLLSELTDRQQEMIVLRYFEGLTLQETADALDCAVGTVKATVWQALRRLREKMEQRV